MIGRKHKVRQVHCNDGLENELWEARSRGHLFARKFQSSDPYWMDLIQSNLHGLTIPRGREMYNTHCLARLPRSWFSMAVFSS
jgi:hypothetical protein